MDILGALTLAWLAQQTAELSQSDRNAIYQILGLMITGFFGAVAAWLGSKGGNRADQAAKAITKAGELEQARVSAGTGSVMISDSTGGHAQIQNWRDLAQEWQDRYREEAQEHDETKAILASVRAELRRVRQQQHQRDLRDPPWSGPSP